MISEYFMVTSFMVSEVKRMKLEITGEDSKAFIK